MAIYRVSGQMLQSTLVRDGNTIAFANTANTTATLFVDVVNNRVGVNANQANVALDVAGDINAYNVSLTGNVNVGNVNATVAVSATGNVTGGNILTNGDMSSLGNVTGGNLFTGNNISATGNATAGNILTSGIVSATGNGTFGNVNTTNISVTANVTAGNVVVGNILIPATGNVLLGNVNINNLATPLANADAATKGYVDTTNAAAWGNLYVSNTTISTSLANGNITLAATGTQLVRVAGSSGFILPVGNTAQRPAPPTVGTMRFNTSTIQTEVWDGIEWASATGAVSVITNQTLTGDGSTTEFILNSAATAESILVTINGVMQTPSVAYTTDILNSTITFTEAPAIADIIQVRFIAAITILASLVNGTSNISIPISDGNVVTTVAGTPIITATATGANVTGYLATTGNVDAGTAVNTNSIVNSGANGTGNIGSSTTYFNTVFATATSAVYADLAEFYSADAVYEPGTVVSFGGDYEVTATTTDADPCIAGVVSTNPSYIMNAGIHAEFPTQVALTGRVPCRVTGPVTKGAMMVSAGNGAARAESTPAMGTVIGKALETFDGAEGTIEIVVGRL